MARLEGRRVGGFLINDRIVVEPGADLAHVRRAFAQAYAAAYLPGTGETLVIERPELAGWAEALVAAGFCLAARKACVNRRLDDVLPPRPRGWTERSLAEVGETAFQERLVEASEGDPFEARRAGPRDTGREWRELVLSAGQRFDPTRWLLVDDATGPIGVLLPQAINELKGTLYYLAIVPARRGQGLGAPLYALGLHRLREMGLAHYAGSTDVRNTAMLAVFARNATPVTGHDAYYVVGPVERRTMGA